MSQPRFSIITITYNAEKTLLPTLRSIIEQTCQDFEYIIIDGGSTDGTVKLVERYQQHVDIFVSEPDKGLYDAMNKGLQRASGEYVWFMNAGDCFHSNYTLRNVERIISQENPDVVYGQTALVNEARNYIGMRRLRAPQKLSWKSFKWGMLVCHQAFVAKRTLAPQYDLQYRFSADFDWCIQVLKQSQKIINSQETLADYLYEGLTTKNRKSSLKERFRIMRKFYGLPVVASLHIWFAFRMFVARLTGDHA